MSRLANVASVNEWETWCGVLHHATGSFEWGSGDEPEVCKGKKV